MSFTARLRVSKAKRGRGRRRNASPRDLPAVAAAEEALPKTFLIFPITGMEALRTSDHGSCGNLSSLEEDREIKNHNSHQLLGIQRLQCFE